MSFREYLEGSMNEGKKFKFNAGDLVMLVNDKDLTSSFGYDKNTNIINTATVFIVDRINGGNLEVYPEQKRLQKKYNSRNTISLSMTRFSKIH
jgi:hypothetical protein